MSPNTWPLSNPGRLTKLERTFAQLGIDVTEPGFHDSPAFLSAERENPNILQDMAAFVESKAYSEDYLAAAREKISISAKILAEQIALDGRLGACVDASATLSRILDALGVWNYVSKATLTMTFPKESRIGKRFFWAFDDLQTAAPHAVVVAPPFGIIDITVKHQPYKGNEAAYLPDLVLADHFDSVPWHAEDLANSEFIRELQRRKIPFPNYIKRYAPSMARAMDILGSPGRLVRTESTQLKYVMTGMGGYTETLEHIAYTPNGIQPHRILKEMIIPRLPTAAA